MRINRRRAITGIAVSAASGIGSLGGSAAAGSRDPEMVVVVKVAGIPWFQVLEKGVRQAGADLGVTASMVGPEHPDPQQQARLVEAAIDRKVDVIGIVPLDVNVLAPSLRRARDAGIRVIAHEGPLQEGRDWDVDLIDPVRFGEIQMESLAREMEGEGDYICFVGTLKTPLHNVWCDAAIAIQRMKYPRMRLAAERYACGEEIDTAEAAMRAALEVNPHIRGAVAFGANGLIGVAGVIKQQGLGKQVAVVGTTMPSQAKPLIMAGIIREAFLWSPFDAGYAMVALGRLVHDGQPVTDGMELRGVGRVDVDTANRLVKADRIMRINRDTVDRLIASGL